jgi:DNA-binding CsgD family transcriptional regulator
MGCGIERRFHRGFTAAEKTELWDRWKRGESLKAIGRAFGKESSSIYYLVAPHGGIRPAERRRSRLALTLAEREVISRGITAHQSAGSIAKLLGRAPSTVSREMSRNGGYNRYRATLADENGPSIAACLSKRAAYSRKSCCARPMDGRVSDQVSKAFAAAATIFSTSATLAAAARVASFPVIGSLRSNCAPFPLRLRRHRR